MVLGEAIKLGIRFGGKQEMRGSKYDIDLNTKMTRGPKE